MPTHDRRTRNHSVRRRDRMMRGLDATGSVAVVGGLLATGLVAGAMGSADAAAKADKVQLSVAQPTQKPASAKPVPRPTKTVIIRKTILVTPKAQPPAQGGYSGQSSTSGGSTWQPPAAPAPVRSANKAAAAPKPPAPKPPAPKPPAPKPSATSAGS